MRPFVRVLRGCAIGLLFAGQPAAAATWICPVGNESIPYDSRDEAHMSQWKERHIEAHREQLGQSGGSATPGLGSTGDPALDLMLPIIQQGSQAIGEELARALFGDPAAEQQAAELRRLQQQQLEEQQRQQQAELERQRRARHERMLRDLVLLDTARQMPLAGLEQAAGVDFDGRAGGAALPLAGLDEPVPAPAGTAFFGTGGGAPGHLDPSVVDLRDLPAYGAAPPDPPPAQARPSAAIREVPLPAIEGHVAQARNGREAQARVAEFEGRIAALPEADAGPLRERLEGLRREARMLEHYDQRMNAFNLARVDQLRELREAREAAVEARRKFAEEALSTLESAVGDFRKAHEQLIRSGVWEQLNAALELEDDVSSARNLHRDLTSLESLGRGQRLDVETWAQLTERAADLGVKIADAHGVLLEKYGQAGAERILGRAGFWVKSGRGLAESTRHSLDLLLLHQETSFIDDELGDAVVQQRRFHEQYARRVRAFQQGRRELEAALAPPAGSGRLPLAGLD